MTLFRAARSSGKEATLTGAFRPHLLSVAPGGRALKQDEQRIDRWAGAAQEAQWVSGTVGGPGMLKVTGSSNPCVYWAILASVS